MDISPHEDYLAQLPDSIPEEAEALESLCIDPAMLTAASSAASIPNSHLAVGPLVPNPYPSPHPVLTTTQSRSVSASSSSSSIFDDNIFSDVASGVSSADTSEDEGLVVTKPQRKVAPMPKRARFVSVPPIVSRSRALTPAWKEDNEQDELDSDSDSNSEEEYVDTPAPCPTKRRQSRAKAPRPVKKVKASAISHTSATSAASEAAKFHKKSGMWFHRSSSTGMWMCPMDGCHHSAALAGDIGRHLQSLAHAEDCGVEPHQCFGCNKTYTREDAIKRHHKRDVVCAQKHRVSFHFIVDKTLSNPLFQRNIV